METTVIETQVPVTETVDLSCLEPTETACEPRLFAHFKSENEDPETAQEEVVQFAIAFAKECGCNDEDAEKLRGLLIGTPNDRGEVIPGPMALVTWEIYLSNHSEMVRQNRGIWKAMAGYLPVTGKNGVDYNIVLRKPSTEDKQISLGIAIQKVGSMQVNADGSIQEQEPFWTYALVITQTEKRKNYKGVMVPGLPLSLAYDVNAAETANGKQLTGQWSRRIYFPPARDGSNGTVNRLANLIRTPNDELIFLGMLGKAGFPIHTARVNRTAGPNRNQQWAPRGQVRQASTLVGASVGGSSIPAVDGDPFAS